MATSTEVSKNMFVYGMADSYNSFKYHQDVDPDFTVGADYLQNIDNGGGSSINYKDDMYPCVSHKSFRLSANYAAVDAGKTANAVCFVKITMQAGRLSEALLQPDGSMWTLIKHQCIAVALVTLM